MKCPECDSPALDYESVDFIYDVIDVCCNECHCTFKLNIDTEPFDIKNEKED